MSSYLEEPESPRINHVSRHGPGLVGIDLGEPHQIVPSGPLLGNRDHYIAIAIDAM